MILIDKYKCGYRITPKVCSSTICNYFADVLNIKPTDKWKQPKDAVRKGMVHSRGFLPNDYYLFCFVRNPWSRLVSGYHELIDNYFTVLETDPSKRPGGIAQNKKWAKAGKLTIQEMADLMDKPYTFANFIKFVTVTEKEHHAHANAHWDSQCNQIKQFWCENRDRLISISDYDFIGRFETFEPDFKHVVSSIKCPESTIPWKHKRLAKLDKTYKDYYTNQDMIDSVGKHYEEDVDTFKYTF